MTNPNDPAFVRRTETEYPTATSGLSKLEYFAGIAMQGMLASCNGFAGNEHGESNNLAKCAVIQAKALIEQLNKQQS